MSPSYENNQTTHSALDAIQEPITNAPPEVKTIIQQVLNLEKAKLYLKSPRNINEEILQIIKDVIK
ncbi:MAG: hypothetical protein QNJ65_07670 [Xenococcaceae cyanobacterium MO_234.B1]|nr:hypothetical protein [Xenococcaceae cyanobacterium MO_234.B1]